MGINPTVTDGKLQPQVKWVVGTSWSDQLTFPQLCFKSAFLLFSYSYSQIVKLFMFMSTSNTASQPLYLEALNRQDIKASARFYGALMWSTVTCHSAAFGDTPESETPVSSLFLLHPQLSGQG